MTNLLPVRGFSVSLPFPTVLRSPYRNRSPLKWITNFLASLISNIEGRPDSSDYLDGGSSAHLRSFNDDESFVQESVDAHYRSLYQYALSLCRSESDACDLTQETILTFIQKGSQLRDRERVRPWLYTTLYRHFVRQHHDRRREEVYDETLPDHTTVFPANQAIHLDGHLVMNSLHKLEEGHRAVMTLYYLEDLSYREIATSLDMPIGTVMSRLSRAKEILRAELCA